MEASSAPFLPIKLAFLSEFQQRANGFLAKVEWRPKAGVLNSPQGDEALYSYRESSLTPNAPEVVSLLKLARSLSRDEALLSDGINHVLHTLRQGLKLGMYLSKVYTEASGLERLIDMNRRGGLTDSQTVEFRAKYHTASAVMVFVTAYYTLFELNPYKAEEVGSIQLGFPGLPELSLQNPVQGAQCLLFYYGMFLDSSQISGELDVIKMTLLYFQAVLDELKLREGSLDYTEPFTERSYRLENSDFTLNGFEVNLSGAETSIEFNRVELSQIVGNREAKHNARRLVERLLCYDLKTQRNPFVELGGFPTLRLGYGKPGTGKSLQIAATATMLHDHCQELGVPFLFWPMPDTIVSTYQGGSAERMVNWMRPLQDPSKIIYAPIDDGENNLEDRSRQGVSAGVREVIGVFLRYTEGAYAVNRGNSAIDIFTNIPDQIDKAVLSRIVARFAVDGAETTEDFLDQDFLWWQRFEQIDEKFIDMDDPRHYTYLAAQALLKSLSSMATVMQEPSEARIQTLVDEIKRRYKPKEQVFFAELYRRVHQEFPFFTSRDVRNIQQAVNNRIMDFDLPEDWFVNHSLFFARGYEDKKRLLTERIYDNMRGLSFAEIRLQETISYLDNMIRIASVTRERRLNELIDEAKLQAEVRARLNQRESATS